MSAITDFLVKILLPTIEQLGETALIGLLQKYHDNDPEEYKATMIMGHTFIKRLVKYADGTEGKIDDGFVDALDEAITTSALANGIIFD